jgi:tRNA nucleotidyltransferase (CCA-adding enzyme)
MSKEHVSHNDIKAWAENNINLPAERASKFRKQALGLRERLQKYLSEHPEFALKKMLISGSLAKGTALKSLNDIDVACYISGKDIPSDIPKLLDYLEERLRTAFPNFTQDQIKRQTYSICVSFKTTGLDVDIVPIIYRGDPDWYGDLVSQDDGSFLETCIPRHLEFIRERKKKCPSHFAQVIRMAKFWVRQQKISNPNFKFKSFVVEAIFAKLLDDGVDFTDYPEALQSFFTYIIKSDLKELIAFSDYYTADKIPVFTDLVRVIDPVNPENNAAKLVTSHQLELIQSAAMDAGDAIDAALSAITKEKTTYYWKKIFGSTFRT